MRLAPVRPDVLGGRVSAVCDLPLISVDEWADMVRDPTRDDRYLTHTRLGSAIADYLAWKRVEDGAAEATVDTYERILAQLATQRPAKDISTLTIDDMRAVRNLRPAGSHRIVTAVYRDFGTWLYEEGRTRENVAGRLRYPKLEKALITGLFSDDEKAEIVAAQDLLRDRLCVLLLLRAGIRKGELRNLLTRDLDVDERLVIVRRGKGGKSRRVPIRGSALHAATVFKLEPIPRLNRAPEPTDYVLYGDSTKNRYGPPDPSRQVAQSTAHRWWYRCLERAGIVDAGVTKDRNMHLSRHTYATDLGRATNWNMVAVSKNLGHSSIAITVDTYTEFAFEDQELAVDMLPEIETL